jgi:hypothetical protein
VLVGINVGITNGGVIVTGGGVGVAVGRGRVSRHPLSKGIMNIASRSLREVRATPSSGEG